MTLGKQAQSRILKQGRFSPGDEGRPTGRTATSAPHNLLYVWKYFKGKVPESR